VEEQKRSRIEAVLLEEVTSMEMRHARTIRASSLKRGAVAVDTCAKKRVNTGCMRWKSAVSRADPKSVLNVGLINLDPPTTKNASRLYNAPLREVREA
jgi:hypothetical protein